MPKFVSDEELLEAVRIRAEHRTLKDAARALDVATSTLQNRLIRAAARGLDGSVPAPIPQSQIVKGLSTLYRTNEDGTHTQLLQWVKTKDDSNFDDIVAALKAAFESHKGAAPVIDPPKHSHKELMSVYPIADQHNGLMAWGRETGENYDLKIGADRLRLCASRLVAQSPASDTALILNLGDWTHNDDQRNMTPASGHILDVDGRYFKVLQTGVQLMMDVIEMALTKHRNVIVRNLPGNHDPHASIALTVALGAFYHNNPRVRIDDNPSEFFYYQFGQTLIGATHGHKLKADKMAMHMAVSQREAWGKTKYHWFLHGHIHHQSSKEIGDVHVESFQTLAGKDSYSASHGYCAGQSITCITLHVEEGEIGRHRVNFSPT